MSIEAPIAHMYALLFRDVLDLVQDDLYFKTMRNATDDYEISHIKVSRRTLLLIYHNIFLPLRPALLGFERNIDFLDVVLPDNLEAFRIACDWCSLCNGMLHTAVENIVANPYLINQIGDLSVAIEYLSHALRYRQQQIAERDVINFCQIFGVVTPAQRELARLYLQFEAIELRWCPFKRSRATYYRNRDGRYVVPTVANIMQIGQVLSRQDTVDCRDCPRVVNAALPRRNRKSALEPILRFMVGQLESPGDLRP